MSQSLKILFCSKEFQNILLLEFRSIAKLHFTLFIPSILLMEVSYFILKAFFEDQSQKVICFKSLFLIIILSYLAQKLYHTELSTSEVTIVAKFFCLALFI